MTNPLEGTTPGPRWHIEGCDHGVGGLEVVAKGWGAVCHGIPDYDDLGDENPLARLIASAPDLATENAALRAENERLERGIKFLTGVNQGSLRLVGKMQYERDALRTHLRDVVIPALIIDVGHVKRCEEALRSTRELVGDE